MNNRSGITTGAGIKFRSLFIECIRNIFKCRSEVLSWKCKKKKKKDETMKMFQ